MHRIKSQIPPFFFLPVDGTQLSDPFFLHSKTSNVLKASFKFLIIFLWDFIEEETIFWKVVESFSSPYCSFLFSAMVRIFFSGEKSFFPNENDFSYWKPLVTLSQGLVVYGIITRLHFQNEFGLSKIETRLVSSKWFLPLTFLEK